MFSCCEFTKGRFVKATISSPTQHNFVQSESKVYIIVLSAVQDMNEKERKTLEVEIKEKLDSRSNALQKFKEEKTMLFY